MYIRGPPLWVPRGLYIYIYVSICLLRPLLPVLLFRPHSLAGLFPSFFFRTPKHGMPQEFYTKQGRTYFSVYMSVFMYIYTAASSSSLTLAPALSHWSSVIRPHNAKRRYTAGQGIDSLNVENQFTFWVPFRAVYTRFKCVFPSLTVLLAVRCSLVDLSQDAGTRTGYRKSWSPSVVAPPS